MFLTALADAAKWIESELVTLGVTPAVIKQVAGKVLLDLMTGATKEQVLQDVVSVLKNVLVPQS